MATPIPAFVAQWYSDGETVTVDTNETVADLWYYFISNRTTASNGQSLLKQVKDRLTAADGGGGTWTVQLNSSYKVTLAHTGAYSADCAFSSTLLTALGLDEQPTVGIGVTYTAARVSPLLWTPDMPISMTGPQQFDPATNYGVPSSAGNVQRAPDMTAAAVSNGIQWAAEYRFNGVSPYYKVRKVAASSNHVNEDLETFWSSSLALGRRVLMWRDRLNLVGSNAPSEGSASPYNYVEYFPSPELREKLPGTPMTPYVMTHWDVSLPFLVTENGETPLTD